MKKLLFLIIATFVYFSSDTDAAKVNSSLERLLPAFDQLQRLPLLPRSKLIEELREAVKEIEAQSPNAFYKAFSSPYEILVTASRIILPLACAGTGDRCVFAGHMQHVGANGLCTRKERCNHQGINDGAVCNPILFGPGVCVGRDGQGWKEVTAHCARVTPHSAADVAASLNSSDVSSWNALRDGLLEYCSNPRSGDKKACEVIKLRLELLYSLMRSPNSRGTNEEAKEEQAMVVGSPAQKKKKPQNDFMLEEVIKSLNRVTTGEKSAMTCNTEGERNPQSFNRISPKARTNASEDLGLAARRFTASVWQSCDIIDPSGSKVRPRRKTGPGCINLPEPGYSMESPMRNFVIRGNQISLGPDNISDCSSYVSAIIASAGWRFTKGKDIGNADQWGTGTMRAKFGKADSCWEAVTFDGISPPIQIGDLIINTDPGRHVIMISDLNNPSDPMMLKGDPPKNPSDCERVRAGSAGWAIDNSSKPVELNWGFVHHPYYKEACLSHLERSQGKAPKRRAIGKDYFVYRQKGTPECRAKRTPMPLGHECIESCPTLMRNRSFSEQTFSPANNPQSKDQQAENPRPQEPNAQEPSSGAPKIKHDPESEEDNSNDSSPSKSDSPFADEITPGTQILVNPSSPNEETVKPSDTFVTLRTLSTPFIDRDVNISSVEDKVVGFRLRNSGSPKIVPNENGAFREWSFFAPKGAKQEMALTINESANPDGNDSDYTMLSELLFFPRQVVPSLRYDGAKDQYIATLPTGEEVFFDRKTKEIVGGALVETEAMDTSENRHTRSFAGLKYLGKGIMIRSDQRGESPRLERVFRNRNAKKVVITYGEKSCKVNRSSLFHQDIASVPEEKRTMFKFANDQEFYRALKSLCPELGQL